MIVLVLILAAAMVPAKVPTVKPPDTPAGRALTEFVQSFNAGSETRRKWVETRTTVHDAPRADILKSDEKLLQNYGRISVARIVNSSPASVVAIVRHARSGAHGYLTINVEPAAPHKVVNLGMRAARPDEIRGSVRQ